MLSNFSNFMSLDQGPASRGPVSSLESRDRYRGAPQTIPQTVWTSMNKEISEQWELSKIAPIHKKGNKQEISNQ